MTAQPFTKAPVFSLPQDELLTLNAADIPVIKDALAPGVNYQPLSVAQRKNWADRTWAATGAPSEHRYPRSHRRDRPPRGDGGRRARRCVPLSAHLQPLHCHELRRDAAASEFTFTVLLRQLPHRDLMVELSLGIGLGALRLLVAPDFGPLRVTVQHARSAEPEAYEKLFGCPIEFESTQNCLTLPNSALNQRIHGSDSAARALAEKYLAPIRPDLAVADHVHDLIQRLLPLNQASLVQVAREMSLHPRVLQRRLAESDTTFEAILDDIRRTSAQRLSATGLQVAQIARMLGYSEQSSYTRACKRWFGKSHAS